MKIIYAHTTSANYVRVKKNLDFFDSLGDEVIYFGAQRVGQEKDNVEEFNNYFKNVMVSYYKRTIPHGIKSLFYFLGYIISLKKIIKKHKPNVVIITNEELYLAVLLGNIGKTKIILDAIDALDIRVDANSFFRGILRNFVTYVRKNVDIVVEVEEFRSARFPEFLHKTKIIRNTPFLIEGIDSKIQVNNETKYIYASGSLNQDLNGIETLVKAVTYLNEKEGINVSLKVAGILNGENLSRIVKKSKFVEFIGSVSFIDSLKMALGSIAMYAFYRPDRLNFIYAAPNKVYESFMLGKPILINNECFISQYCVSMGNGYISGYNDYLALSKNIRDICTIEDSKKFDSLKLEFISNMCWDIEKNKWLDILRK
jgi:glycosyltransferase involved in cell wall biosynthesis